MHIPYFSMAKMNLEIKSEMSQAFENIYDSEWYILGEALKTYEDIYAKWSGTQYCVGVANGLDALTLCLKALGIGPGMEVIVPSNTYIATWLAVTAVGAKPIPVEPDIKTYNINPEDIRNAITSKTRAIIPVHLFGQACQMAEIMAIAEAHNIFVVEDNAQAHGATFGNKPTGSFGDLNATSFYPSKNLGALGDAGAITTNREVLYDRVRLLRNYGSANKYYNIEQGVNSRLDEIQAAFLTVKIKYIDSWNKERIKIAEKYTSVLNEVEELSLPVIADQCSSVYHIYGIRSSKRDDLQKYLAAHDIATLIHYPIPPHLQKAYSSLGYQRGDFPVAEEIADTLLSLPIYPGLTNEEITYITTCIKIFYTK